MILILKKIFFFFYLQIILKIHLTWSSVQSYYVWAYKTHVGQIEVGKVQKKKKKASSCKVPH